MAVVTARLTTGTAVDMPARQFSWRGDEPPLVGGTDTGPTTPYELLRWRPVSRSRCGCTRTTKAISLAAVDVRLEFDRIHANDCLDCDERADGWIDQIHTQVTIHGAFTEAQRLRLAQVAERCPVHKTLAHGVQIVDAGAVRRRFSVTAQRPTTRRFAPLPPWI